VTRQKGRNHIYRGVRRYGTQRTTSVSAAASPCFVLIRNFTPAPGGQLLRSCQRRGRGVGDGYEPWDEAFGGEVAAVVSSPRPRVDDGPQPTGCAIASTRSRWNWRKIRKAPRLGPGRFFSALLFSRMKENALGSGEEHATNAAYGSLSRSQAARSSHFGAGRILKCNRWSNAVDF